jgi:hypothetical protein
LKVFDVPTPTKEQTVQIAHRVYAKLLKSHWGQAFDAALHTEVAEALGARRPRDINKTLLSALGKAAIDERTSLVVEDLDDPMISRTGSNYSGSKIGFVGDN